MESLDDGSLKMDPALQISIVPTDVVGQLDGIPVRLWLGGNLKGQRFAVFVHRVAAIDPAAQEDCSRILIEQIPPRIVTEEELVRCSQRGLAALALSPVKVRGEG